MFYDCEAFPFTKKLEDNWQMILSEFQTLHQRHLKNWHERRLHNQNWKVFGLFSFGKKLKHNCRLCPKTATILEQIPGLVTAGYSILLPGAHIKPHKGYSGSVLRCHLGLETPNESKIIVAGETRKWEQGKCLIFDDTFIHEARNESNQDRVVLLFDFKKKMKLNYFDQMQLACLRFLARKSIQRIN